MVSRIYTWMLVAALTGGVTATAQGMDNPANFNFDGVLQDNSGNPLTGTHSIVFQIYDPAASCLLFEETHASVTLDAAGSFSLKVGSGSRASPGVDGGVAWKNIFSNRSQVRAPGSNCAGGYTPAIYDSRALKVTVDGTPLTPNFVLGSVPFATVADSVQGYQPSDFLSSLGGNVNGFLKMNAANEVRFADSGSTNYVALKAPGSLGASTSYTLPAADGTPGFVLSTNGAGQMSWVSAGGSGTVTNVASANSDISVATPTTTPTLTLNSGTAGGVGDANKIAKLNGSGQLPVAMLPALDVSNIGSGTLPIVRGGTNSMAALANNRIMISSGGAIVEGTAMSANRAMVSDGSGLPSASAVTATELAYLGGVTSNIQTQIDGKQAALGFTPVNKAGDTMTGTLALPANGLAVGGSQLVVNTGNVGIGYGSPAYLLDVNGGGSGTAVVANFGGAAKMTTAGPGIVPTLRISNINVGTNIGPSLEFGVVNSVSAAKTAASISSFLTSNTVSAEQGVLTFNTITNGTPGEKMRIDSNGRVGIGTQFPNASLDLGMKTDAILLPKGTYAQQPGGTPGMLRYNTDINDLEFFNGTAWLALNNPQVITFAGNYIDGGISVGSTYYAPVVGSHIVNGGVQWTSDAFERRTIMNRGGNLRNLIIKMSQDPAATWAFVVRVNAVDTALACNVTSGNIVCTNNGSSVPVNPGDEVGIKIITAGAAGAAKASWAVDLEFP